MKKQPDTVQPPVLSPALRRYLYLTAAVTGAAIMIVEILGAKMLSPYVGTSHFVWTAQIAVTLVALASGYAAGGWLVDRSPRLTWVYTGILAAAMFLCLSVLGCEQVAYFCLRFNLAVGSLLAAGLLFFVPLALLAMVGPFFIRVLTASVASVGGNVGRLTSISTLGSVAGTVLIGYVLIPFLPNPLTMFLTAAMLMAVAVTYFLVWQRKHLAPALTAVVFGGAAGLVGVLQPSLTSVEGLTEVYRGNSNFGLLQVVQTKAGDRRYYLNDLLVQNTYDPATQQSDSLFTYMLHDLARVYTPQIQDALCIGMGIGLVPRQFAREGAKVDVVEINPAVVPLAARYFDFDAARVNVIIGDGRQYLNQTTKQYDTVILDAFLGESPPGHLMTREALGAIQRRLKPGGTLVMNTFAKFEAGRDFFAASLDRTLRSVFTSVRIHAGGNGNVFFVAAAQPQLAVVHPPDFEALPPALREIARRTFDGVMETDPTHGLVLTDDYNPVDYYDAVNREDLRKRLALSYHRE